MEREQNMEEEEVPEDEVCGDTTDAENEVIAYWEGLKNGVMSHPATLQLQCLLYIIGHLHDFTDDNLGLLPLSFRTKLLLLLPAVDVAKLEGTPITHGISMDEIWERIYKERIPIHKKEELKYVIRRGIGTLDDFYDAGVKSISWKEAYFDTVFQFAQNFYSRRMLLDYEECCCVYDHFLPDLLFAMDTLYNDPASSELYQCFSEESSLSIHGVSRCTHRCPRLTPERYYHMYTTPNLSPRWDNGFYMTFLHVVYQLAQHCNVSLKQIAISNALFPDISSQQELSFLPELSKLLKSVEAVTIFRSSQVMLYIGAAKTPEHIIREILDIIFLQSNCPVRDVKIYSDDEIEDLVPFLIESTQCMLKQLKIELDVNEKLLSPLTSSLSSETKVPPHGITPSNIFPFVPRPQPLAGAFSQASLQVPIVPQIGGAPALVISQAGAAPLPQFPVAPIVPQIGGAPAPVISQAGAAPLPQFPVAPIVPQVGGAFAAPVYHAPVLLSANQFFHFPISGVQPVTINASVSHSIIKILQHHQDIEKFIFSLDSRREYRIEDSELIQYIADLLFCHICKELHVIFGSRFEMKVSFDIVLCFFCKFFSSPNPVSVTLTFDCPGFSAITEPLAINHDQSTNKSLQLLNCHFSPNFSSLLPHNLVLKSLTIDECDLNTIVSFAGLESITVESFTLRLANLCCITRDSISTISSLFNIVNAQEWDLFVVLEDDKGIVEKFTTLLSKIAHQLCHFGLRSLTFDLKRIVSIIECIFSSLSPSKMSSFELTFMDQLLNNGFAEVMHQTWERCCAVKLKKITVHHRRNDGDITCMSFLSDMANEVYIKLFH